jgi:outer membrane lipoprotein SlyB
MKELAALCTVFLLTTGALSACSSGHKKDVGMLAGAAVGGLAGSAVAGNTAGTIVGAAGGAYVGRQLAK